MRTLMIVTSLLMVGTGTFCMANSSVAFASTAFVIGIVLILTGCIELIISYKTSINEDRGNLDTTVSGTLLLLLGIVVFSGRISDDLIASAVFALIAVRDGFLDILEANFNFKDNTKEENTGIAIGLLTTLLGIYMFFNSSLLNYPVQALIGGVLVLMGLKRFRISFTIRHVHPGFLKAREDRLADALRDKEKAYAKAKEGIRETKEAERRIEKIKEEMAQEHKMMTDATIRAAIKKVEEELEEARDSLE